MTCRDCVSYEVCRIVRSNGDDRVLENSPCKHFKNKADFVEVVRCKDCTHFAYKDLSEPFCMFGNALCVADDNSYCSYGERKDT